MTGPQVLEKYVGILKTRAGAFVPGERAVFLGEDLHTTLKDLDWLGLYLYGITGRKFSTAQMKVLHALWSYTSYPDARLWNNRVAALAGTTRSTGTLGIAAAIAISEAQIYGWGAALRASEFLCRIKEEIDLGADLSELVFREVRRKRGIAGYGRPIVSADERIEPMMTLVRELGMDDGPHLKLAFEVEKILLGGRWRLHMNYAALSAAIEADIGLTPHQFYMFGIPAFVAGMPPCYLDALGKSEGTLFPVPCCGVQFEGVSRRRWRNKV